MTLGELNELREIVVDALLVLALQRNDLDLDPELTAEETAALDALRGTFHLSYPRQVLFSGQLELHTAQLRRWQPFVAIDGKGEHRRRFAEDDEEHG